MSQITLTYGNEKIIFKHQKSEKIKKKSKSAIRVAKA
jgi:hypothetical protein